MIEAMDMLPNTALIEGLDGIECYVAVTAKGLGISPKRLPVEI
ncbi:MAG: hypothetical protein ACLSA6_08390 [Holdemania massiliensis]